MEQKKLQSKNSISELLKCKNDPIYFIENYIKIFNQSMGVVPFKLFNKQKEFIRLFIEKHKILVLKSRQTGMTTTIEQLQLWLLLFYRNYYIGVLSIEEKRSKKFLEELKEMYYLSNLDKIPWLPKLKRPLQTSLTFSNGSEIRQGNTNNPMRGFRISLIIVDEQQFVENLDEQLKSVGPTLQTIQKSGLPWGIILNSTPNGVNNYYYQIYYNQINNPQGNGYTVFRYHWSEVPYYDEEWYKEQCEILGWDYLQIQQELELKFLSEQNTFIEPKILEILQESVEDPIKILEIENIEVEIYNEPKPNEEYFFGIDVQSGLGQDYSQGVIIDSNGEVQQVLHNQRQDDVQLQRQINYIGKMYNYQKIGIEITGGFGLQVLRRLQELGYPNLFKMKKHQNRTKNKKKPEFVTGILTNQQTRPLILKSLQEYVSQFPENIKSKKIINELLTLVYKNGKVQQKNGFHDDLQMQLQFQYFIRENSIVKTVYSQEDDIHMINLLKKLTINEKINIGDNNEIDSQDLEIETKQQQKQSDNTNKFSKLNWIKKL